MPTTVEPGDIVLVRFPFSDLTTTKVRPAVVLAAHGDDVTIVEARGWPSAIATRTLQERV